MANRALNAQRTWVGMTDEEANKLWESTDSDWELMKRTEAKLKQKNTRGQDTTPQTKVGCVECGVSGGQDFYCVACAKKLFGGYKESESFDRTASHMANEYVKYKEPILTDAEISESYYEVFKTAMIDIKAFEFAYSLLRKAQKK
jgi:hypothetical protein